MRLFSRKHDIEVYDAGFGQWNFRCTCGVHGRAIRSKAEIEAKARIHRESQTRR
ncbi:hypothetical protein [Streptomyces lavendulae]|uniref:hypothetical protein n=1 Tax=Streptomyces lavendulae TaxID=1914 RepID=UPI0031EEC91F